jgi:glyoxylase-like metal-dependent hydrolase (beta-lactamase superfamily II)
VDALRKVCPRILIHELDLPLLTDPELNASAGIWVRPLRVSAPAETVREGQELSPAGLRIQVLHTPGHTPGSVCYRIEDHLFTGDTLFEHGWGRTDFPGGDEHALFASLRRIMPLAKTMSFHPGHEA